MAVGSSAGGIYEYVVQDVFGLFASTKREATDAAARGADGLEGWRLRQALSYAYSPGMMGESGLARLMESARDAASKGWDSDDSRTVYPLALQPLLKRALDDKNQTLETFLPTAVNAWLVVEQLHKVMKRDEQCPAQTYGSALSPAEYRYYRSDPRHSIFTFGIVDRDAIETMARTSQHHLWAREHQVGAYHEMLTNIAKPGDTIVLLLSLDDSARVPKSGLRPHAVALAAGRSQTEARRTS